MKQTRRGRWSSVLLVLALTLLAVPTGLHFGPPVFSALTGATSGLPSATPALPAVQQVPRQLEPMETVTGLSPDAPLPDPQVLNAALNARLSAEAEGNFTGVVLDALTGTVLYDDDAGTPRVPASNLKLLTAVTALETLGAEHRFTTSVVGGADPGQVILVGGGDVLLAAGEPDADAVMGHAGLAMLAAETIHSLTAERRSAPEAATPPVQRDPVSLSVAVDDSLFEGRTVNSGWTAGDLRAGQVAPMHSLALNSGRFTPEDRYGARPQDAALHAAGAFVEALRAAGAEAGITVDAEVTRSETAANAVELAAVQSATVAEQVELALGSSDNYLAEALGRMAALATGQDGSFAGAAKTIMATMAELGVHTTGMMLVDSSGLSSGNRISATQLGQLLSIVVRTEDPDTHAVLDALPVAGLSGTLSDRFTREPELAGAGVVRAKTGTLNAVLSLTGHLVTADGRLLIFSFIGNELGSIDPANERALDESAAILAQCGCRAE